MALSAAIVLCCFFSPLLLAAEEELTVTAIATNGTDFCERNRRFECLSLPTKIVVYIAILVVVLSCMIISFGYLIGRCHRSSHRHYGTRSLLNSSFPNGADNSGAATESTPIIRVCSDSTTQPMVVGVSPGYTPPNVVVHMGKLGKGTSTKSVPEEYINGHSRPANTTFFSMSTEVGK